MSRPKEYFEIQIIYAKKFAQLNHESLKSAIFRNASFYKIFGLRGSKLKQQHPLWQAYLKRIKGVNDVNSLTEFTYEFYQQVVKKEHNANLNVEEPHSFGCFSYQVVDQKQRIDMHFANNETNGRSPLDSFNIIRRKEELKNMILDIRRKYPEINTIYCRTWLLNSNNFKYLMPKTFVQNIKSTYWRTDSSAIWGQFIDYQGKIKSEVAQDFVKAVNKSQSLVQLKSCFKLLPLEAQCMISDFS